MRTSLPKTFKGALVHGLLYQRSYYNPESRVFLAETGCGIKVATELDLQTESFGPEYRNPLSAIDCDSCNNKVGIR